MSFDPLTAILDTAGKVIDKIWPDKNEAERIKVEMFKSQLDAELRKEDNEVRLMLAQLEINKKDAESEGWLQRNWRPMVGWTGVFGFAYSAVIEPAARFVAQVGFGYAGAFPAIDSTITMQVLFGLLGFGAFRSYEKVGGKK